MAIASYKKAISLDDKLSESYYGLGLAYYNVKNMPLAKAQLKILQGLDPERAKTLEGKIRVGAN